jgi:hypothetical protein
MQMYLASDSTQQSQPIFDSKDLRWAFSKFGAGVTVMTAAASDGALASVELLLFFNGKYVQPIDIGSNL